MSGLFRIGIVGAGRIAAQSHVPAVLASPQMVLAALVDPERGRCEELARRFRIQPRIATTLGEVLGDIDGALIATPNHTHVALALECLKAGVHTLIEKPLAVSVQEGEAIVNQAKTAGRVVAVGYSTRFRPSIDLMRRLIDESYFGRIRRFVYQYGGRGGWDPLSSYILDRSATGGGVLVVTGTHFLDRLLHWFGTPDDCTYRDDSCGGPEANSVATFRFTSEGRDIEGLMMLSKTVKLDGGFAMETDAGTVVLADAPDDVRIRLYPRQTPSLAATIARRDEPSAGNVFQRQVENFVLACRTGSAPKVDGRQGVESLRLIERLYGCRQPLKEFGSKSVLPGVPS